MIPAKVKIVKTIMPGFSVLLFFALAIRPAMARKSPQEIWHTGTLANAIPETHTVTRGSYQGGTPRNYADPSWGSYPARGSIHSLPITSVQYTVDMGRCLYTGTLISTHRRAHPPDVTVHAAVQFAYDGKNYYVKDDQGQVFKFLLLTKALAPGVQGTAGCSDLSGDSSR